MIDQFTSTITSVIDPNLLLALFVLSLVAFIGTLIAIPAILVRLPPDYFDENHPRTWMADHHPIIRGLGLFFKNVIGAIFIVAGIAMLVLPGQGILTLLIGISLIDFPGKRALERKLVSHPTVLSSINALRRKFGKPPLTIQASIREPSQSS
ncbi:MAG: hypothetical protein D6690_04155 [Nitrospirae bacterium]|nr:MAG: hypothetical protein D6690_04155 [Nitrospirota bacterium]